VPFGGYKSPASPEFPWAGWAELFAVAGLSAIVAPICEFHPAGAVVEFSSDELIVPRLTGTPRRSWTGTRPTSTASCHVPAVPAANLRLRQSFLRDAYDAPSWPA